MRIKDTSIIFHDQKPDDAHWEKDKFDGVGFSTFGCYLLMPKKTVDMPDTVVVILYTYDKDYKPTSW